MKNANVMRLGELFREWINNEKGNEEEDFFEFLDANGVIIAPVKIGQVVYAALPSIFTDEDSIVYAWEVKGVGIDEKGRYIAFNSHGEHYTVGEESCRLTREEAEEDLRRFEAEHAKEDEEE